MVVVIQCFKCAPSSFTPQDFAFSDPTSALANLTQMQAFPMKFCARLVLYKLKRRSEFLSRILKIHCAAWFQVEAIFQDIQGGASGLPRPFC